MPASPNYGLTIEYDVRESALMKVSLSGSGFSANVSPIPLAAHSGERPAVYRVRLVKTYRYQILFTASNGPSQRVERAELALKTKAQVRATFSVITPAAAKAAASAKWGKLALKLPKVATR